jgi:vancomycin resistance protein YoaR
MAGEEIDLVDEILGNAARSWSQDEPEDGRMGAHPEQTDQSLMTPSPTEQAAAPEPAATQAPEPSPTEDGAEPAATASATDAPRDSTVAASEAGETGESGESGETGETGESGETEGAEVAAAPAAVGSAALAGAVPQSKRPPVGVEPVASKTLALVPVAAGAAAARSSLTRRLIGFLFIFVLGIAASLTLSVGAAAGITTAYQNRVVAGVRVGSLDVSGMTPDELVSARESAYASLSQGKVTITTPTGVATMSYQDAGRVADVEEMANAAMNVGHTGDFIPDAITIAHSALQPVTIPIAIKLDPAAIATHVRDMLKASRLLPVNAVVTVAPGGTPSIEGAATGSELDEKAVDNTIVDALSAATTPVDLQVGSAFVTLEPQVGDKDAEEAIAASERMAVDLNLNWTGLYDPPPVTTPSPSPDASQSADPSAAASPAGSPSLVPTAVVPPTPTPTPNVAPARTFVISASTVRSWIVFGTLPDGSYGPAIDPSLVQGYLSGVSTQVATKPVEPSVVYGPDGKPSSLKGGQDGVAIDLGATSQAIESYLQTLAAGSKPAPVTVVAGPVHPRITIDDLSKLAILNGGKGTWTTTFYPDISNGYGANIRTPAKLLNGQVIAPGQQFDFLAAVGPIDSAHGYTLGGVIEHGKSNHTGAIGGGICSASTTMFNAAAWSGLQIDERHAHAYYIDRYPVGLDATVFSNGYQTYDLKWTNDTDYPIVIRSWATYGSRSTITIQLWSMPLDRTVTFSAPYKADIIKASDSTVYTTALAPGQKNRAEYPTDGFYTSRTRTVVDNATGKVLHADSWTSHYVVVNGILEIGTSAPVATPTPAPPADTPAPPPASPA